ncbi:MAG: hypothetical protein SFW66_10775 [Gammaproteobacteria bacterium]|nr:hypothetical protein [Gammaproteobacteria bacterium]
MTEKFAVIVEQIKEKLDHDSFEYSILNHRIGFKVTQCTIDDMKEFVMKTACRHGLLNELHALLELNLLENILWNQGETLLDVAMSHGQYEIIQYLLEVRVDKKDFKQFCIDHAVEGYIRDNQPSFGYTSVECLFSDLDALSEDEWKHIVQLLPDIHQHIKSEPALSEHNQIQMCKKGLFAGATAAFCAYFVTENIILAFTTGAISTALALKFMAQAAMSREFRKESAQSFRTLNVLQHNRFFMAAVQGGALREDNEVRQNTMPNQSNH